MQRPLIQRLDINAYIVTVNLGIKKIWSLTIETNTRRIHFAALIVSTFNVLCDHCSKSQHEIECNQRPNMYQVSQFL